jgi:hypothetical protein
MEGSMTNNDQAHVLRLLLRLVPRAHREAVLSITRANVGTDARDMPHPLAATPAELAQHDLPVPTNNAERFAANAILILVRELARNHPPAEVGRILMRPTIGGRTLRDYLEAGHDVPVRTPLAPVNSQGARATRPAAG